MSAFEKFEKGVENAVNSLFSRAFSANLQPVELATGIKKAMDDRASSITRERIVVPNSFTIALTPGDFGKIAEWGEAELITELTKVAQGHAREQRYTFLGPISINFEERDSLAKGKFIVAATAKRGAVIPATYTSASDQNPIIEIGADRYILAGARTTIGRGSSCDIVLDDAGVSRKHLELRVTPNGVIAKDLDTTNGSFVEGHRITAATLVDGNTITIGRTKIMFWTSPEAQ
ncbi:DUF3662 and FHA domain-containing protein [Arcanobacterium hippocoleae]|uniref:FHA domain-containing protein n=1 Tax=Arcanobacterium hippocoleae TaxID=149017 RepID=A0ABU1T2F9_9ACTO|nr:DUF3662 and FHA domain-containing protein [Arcanobacterium hippocoleae]MDR6939539.1 hypothetical protein [Arcanobacterium hippocoleae]